MFGFKTYKTSDLISAIKENDLDELKVILTKTPALLNESFEWKASVPSMNCSGTALHYAAYWGSPDIIEFLIKEKDIYVNITSEDTGYTPLHFAAKYNSYEAARILIKLGAIRTAENHYYKNPFNLSHNDNMREIIDEGYKDRKEAQERKERLKQEEEKIKRDFYRFIKKGEVKELKEALDKSNELLNKIVEWDGGQGYPIHYAAWYNQPEIIEFLVIEYNVDINIKKNVSGHFVPLHHAIKNNSIDSIKKLIALGADIDLKTSKGESSFDLCENNDIRDIIIPGYKEKENNKKAYCEALKSGNLSLVKKLLNKSSELLDSSFKWRMRGDNYKGSALNIAASYNHPHIIEFLIKEKDFDINAQQSEYSQWTPLHFAVKCEAYEAARKLINMGADINLKSNGGYIAGYYRSSDIMREIVDLEYREKLEKERSDKLKGTWKKYSPEEIVHIYNVENFRITDIFNFRARNWKSMTKDIKSGAISQETLFFDNIPNKEILLEALKMHNENFGGNIDENTVFANRMITKQQKLG